MRIRSVISPRQRAEFRDHAAGAERVGTARDHGLNVDREGIALLGSLDHDWAILWVEKGHLEKLRRFMRLLLDLSFEGVACFYDDTISRLHVKHRIGVGAHRVVILALLLLREVVGIRITGPADPPRSHDGRLDPVCATRNHVIHFPSPSLTFPKRPISAHVRLSDREKLCEPLSVLKLVLVQGPNDPSLVEHVSP